MEPPAIFYFHFIHLHLFCVHSKAPYFHFFEVKIHLNLESAEWRLPPNEIQVEMNEKKNEINCADELTGAEYSNETSFHAPRSVLIDVHLWLIERHTTDEIISARFGRCHGDRVAFFGGEKWQLT